MPKQKLKYSWQWHSTKEDRKNQSQKGVLTKKWMRTGQDRTGQDGTGRERTGRDGMGWVGTGQDRTGQDRTGTIFMFLAKLKDNNSINNKKNLWKAVCSHKIRISHLHWISLTLIQFSKIESFVSKLSMNVSFLVGNGVLFHWKLT